MGDTGDSTTPKESDHKNEEKAEENYPESDGAQQQKMDGTGEIVTEAEPLASTTPKESDHKNKEKAEENDPESDGAQQQKMERTGEIVTEAEPLSWRPPAEYHQLLMPAYQDGKCYGLPAGWQVERRPRTSPKYFGKVDQFYYEPGTNRQFRSLKAVLRHLQATGQQHEQLPRAEQQNDDQQATRQQNEHTPDQAIKHGDQCETSQSSKRRSGNKPGRKRKQAASSSFEFDFANPPEKVTWALTDAENDIWKPSVGETVVSEAVKDLWTETFVTVIYQKNKAPKL